LDEIDSLVSKRWGNVDASKAEEVSQFLQEFNNLEDAPNLIIIWATNRPDHLDSAILSLEKIQSELEKHTLSMELLKKAIEDTTPSLKMVDMSIYTEWLKKIEK